MAKKNPQQTLESLWNSYNNKCFQVRNDYEQKRMLKLHLNKSRRSLEENIRKSASRRKRIGLDVVIHQLEGTTELYLPIKENDSGALYTTLTEHVQEALQEESGSDPQQGTYANFLVMRTPLVDSMDLAKRLVAKKPARFGTYKVELVPGFTTKFYSEAVYGDQEEPQAEPEPSPPSPRRPRTRRSSTVQTTLAAGTSISASDIDRIRGYLSRGLSPKEMHAEDDSLTTQQYTSYSNHVKLGTYDRPKRPIDDTLRKKIHADIKGGLDNQEISEKYDINRFQIVAQRAQYTRRQNSRRKSP